MNLQSLATVTSEQFLRDLSNNLGPHAFRLSYPVKDLAVCQAIGRDLHLLFSINQGEPILLGHVQDKKNPVCIVISTKDVSIALANAMAYINQGSGLRSSANALKEYHARKAMPYNIAAPTRFTGIFYEYAWRCAARMSKDRQKLMAQTGPLFDYLRGVIAEHPANDSDQIMAIQMLEEYVNLNDLQFADRLPQYKTTDDLRKIVERDTVYCTQWQKALSDIRGE